MAIRRLAMLAILTFGLSGCYHYGYGPGPVLGGAAVGAAAGAVGGAIVGAPGVGAAAGAAAGAVVGAASGAKGGPYYAGPAYAPGPVVIIDRPRYRPRYRYRYRPWRRHRRYYHY
ncbi:MAG: hypothetical protein AAF675_12355 [Pseudomonadota bacterium]